MRGAGLRSRCPVSRNPVELSIEQQDIDPRFADKSQQRIFCLQADNIPHLFRQKIARAGDAGNLGKGRLRTDMGIKP